MNINNKYMHRGPRAWSHSQHGVEVSPLLLGAAGAGTRAAVARRAHSCRDTIVWLAVAVMVLARRWSGGATCGRRAPAATLGSRVD